MASSTSTIQVPLVSDSDVVQIGDSPSNISLTPGSDAVALSTFVRIRCALQANAATLADGKPVSSYRDAFRWILQQVSANDS